MTDFPPLVPLDIDLDEPLSPGPDWVYQGPLSGKLVFKNRRDDRLLFVSTNGVDPPSEWGLLAN